MAELAGSGEMDLEELVLSVAVDACVKRVSRLGQRSEPVQAAARSWLALGPDRSVLVSHQPSWRAGHFNNAGRHQDPPAPRPSQLP